jgi:SpoVK/Ycf46/Vps4 family AAA+-type ATPase
LLNKPIEPSESIGAKLKKYPTQSQDNDNPQNDKALSTVEQFKARKPHYTFENIILPETTQKNIKILLSRIKHHDLLYQDWELAKIDLSGRNKIVNFYGLPGTGKTISAEALAAKLQKNLVEVNYAEIESKYVGETGKNISLAFQKAAEQDAVLFFDEADSILGRRMTDVRQAADQAVNVSRAVMLKELDKFSGIVVFATNLAKNFDGAFVRRILLHVEVAPPDMEGRVKLWQKMISSKVPGQDKLDWQILAESSEGFTGGDIKNAVIISLSEAADRPAEKQILHQQDVLDAIENIRRAKMEIG